MAKILRALSASAVAVATLSAGSAMAASAGDWLLRAGVSQVAPNDDSSVLYVNGAPQAGTGVSVDSDARPSFTIGYMLTDNWAVEVLGALPFEHDIGAQGLGGAGVNSVGSTKHLPPTVSLQYHFNITPAFKPYLGLGLNYTVFFDEELSGQLKGAGYTKLDLDDSFGAAAQIGFDYEFEGGWLVNADVRYIDIDTEGTVSGPGALGTPVTVDVDIDPVVYTLAIGKRF